MREQSFPPVEEAESGQKLLRFLERRLSLPSNLLHRWIRTGQIRVNGGRSKPFARVEAGDVVRLPPFAEELANEAREASPPIEALPLPPLIGEWKGLLAYDKPRGLPAQPGAGHDDSLSSRLAANCADGAFRPAPCHRLDRDTTGVILVGATFEALRSAQEALAAGKIHKEYLAWVDGDWPHEGVRRLRGFLRKETRDNVTKTRVVPAGAPYSREAVCYVRPLLRRGGRSLLQIRLATGRGHQIRAQLAACGYPVSGDGKYGKPGEMRLHSARVILPDGHEFSCAPDWPAPWGTAELPPPLLDSLLPPE